MLFRSALSLSLLLLVIFPAQANTLGNDFVYERDDDGYNREKRDVDDIQSSGDEEIVVHDSDIIALKSSMADKSEKANDTKLVSPPALSSKSDYVNMKDVDLEEDEGLLQEFGSGMETTTFAFDWSSSPVYETSSLDLVALTPPLPPSTNQPSTADPNTLPTLAPPPTAPAASFFRVTMNVTSEPCTSALTTRGSPEFSDFQTRWSDVITSLVGDLPGRQVVTVISLTCGSLLVNFDIGSMGFSNGAEINSRLMDAVKQGLLGEFTVSPISYDFMPLGQTGGGNNRVEVTTAQPSRSCTAAEFRCNSGDCVGLDVMCDGRSDCLDGSDERNCRICDAATEFDCGGGFCVNSQYRCDGRQDCPSNRDEENCASLIQVTVSPKTSAVEVGESATFTCSATCPRAIQSCDVQWGFNSVNGRLPAGVDTTGTFLRVGYADLSHTGVYYCSVIGYSQISDYAELTVRRRASCSANEFTCNNQRCVSRSLLCNNVDDCGDRTDEANCIESNQCEPPEMRCANGKCVQKFWRCDGDDDCKDGTDEQNQYCPIVPPNSFCAANQFQCASGNQCTRKSYVCDKQFDCLDRSDEIGCSAPVCTQAPRRTITVNVGETITISCTCIGKPVPYISWRLNWGHIPSGSRVTETSVNGVGTLIIRDARPSDAGAYTCEAVNNQNSVFANPDAIVTVNEIINSCPAGQFNPGNCLPCYCSDLSSTCRSSNMVMREIYIRSQVTLVDERGLEVSTSLYSDDRNGKYTVPVYSWLPSGNHYWKLPSSLTGNQLNMYGGILKYRISYEDLRRSSLSDVYDVIIKGAFSTTYCRAAATYVPGRDVRISLQMIEDFCYQASTGSSADIRIPSPTSREEYMNILMNVEHILIRATYSSTQTSTSISDISVEQAAPSGSTKPATMVEVCDSCPAGYVGNSCEDCDKGYRRLPPSQYYPRGECVRDVAPCLCNGHSQTCDELDGTCLFCQHNTEGSRCQYCKAGYIGDATVGRPDDCQPIPTPCNRDGTDYEDRGRCVCKAFATGQYCDQCKATSFYLNDHSAGGCTQCFCMGITSNCDSSSDRRDDITVSYNTADDWSLAESNSQPVLGNVLSANGREIIASLRLLGAGSYYWSLPSQFTGNKLAAYGGKLRFTSKFVAPSVDQPNRDADVILFGAEGIQLTATFEGIILDNRQHNAEIVMLENYWRRADSSPSTREHFLMALSDIQYILVKASFTRNTEESRIEDVRLDIASTTGLGARAYDVEQCACPAGYVGSSCETCAPGYMRAPGLYLGVCNRCSCNGHSDDCTSDQCLNCNHGTTGRFCERCAPGYVRNARDQSPHECINPTSAAVIESPTIRVTIGGRAEFVCRPYSADLPYSSIIWRRSDGQPLPRTASQSQPGRLIIDNVQLTYSGDYVCVITTAGGVDASSIASLVVVTSTCPTGYENLPDCNICSVGYTKDAYGRCVPSSTQIVVTVSPSNSVRVSEGQSIRLLCSARSQVDNSVYVVSWSREGARLPGTAVEANGQLYIAQSAVADSGIYVCTGSNQFGRQTAQVSVRVDPILPPTTVLTVEVDPDKLYITEGLSGVLRCKITGDARSVTWRRSSNTPITSKNRVSTSVVSGDTLTIIGMDVNDRGYYYCTAVGADATTRVTSDRPALVDFKRTGSDDDSKEAGHSFVTILNIDVRVTEGDPARLECRADSSVRASSISWSKNGQQLYSDKGVLVIQATSVSDSGTYTCTIYTVTGDYQSKEARITVTQRPVTLPAPEVRIRDSGTGTLKYAVGANVQLFCDQVAGPQGLNVYWESGEVGRPLASNVIANGGLLSIQSITLANRGLYVCIGTDGRRLDRKEVYIQVEELKISLPEVIDAPMGEGVEITCSVSRRTLTDTIPTVYWRNSRGQRLTDITSLESTLQFNPVRMSHAGNYTCVAEIPGASSSATLVLRVIPSPTGPIRFAQNPLDLRVQIGESASVDCQPTTSLITSTTWSRDNANSLPSTAVQRGSQLDFRSIRLADAGTYICTAISSLGSGSLYVNLIVEGPPGLPVVTANGDQLAPNGVKVYNVGDSVTLNCIAEGSPAPQYSWSRMLVQGSFQPLYTGGNVQISYGTLSGLGSQLVLSNVQTSDAGYYNCSASNIYASRDTYARLVINPANNGGNFAPTDAKVRGSGSGILRNMYNIGDTAILRCQASSATPVSYRWTFSNGALPTNAYSKSAVLEIVNMGKSNEGIYYCTVQNAAGSSRPAAAQVFVSSGTNSGPGSVPAMPTTAPGAPVVHKIKEGDSVSMSCLSDVNTSWKRDNGQRLSANSYSSTASLRILDVKPGDQGRYLCVATNQYGDSAPLVHTLYVETPATVRPETPSVSITADSSVNIGDTVDLRCTSDIQTASITWSRAEVGVQLPENSAVSGQYLRIYNFKAEDAGYYVCTATTPQGSGIATHQLYALSSVLSAQIRAVGSLARPSTPNEYAEGSELRLYCEASDSSASVTWERLGDSLPAQAYISSTALIFRSLEEIDRGTYRCTASTSSSSVIADFRFDVIDTRSLGGAAVSSVEIYSGIIDYIDIGSRIELNCSAVGDDVYYEWKLQDGSALPSDAIVVDNVLIIPSFMSADQGTYVCTASNLYGQPMSHSLTLEIKAPISSVKIITNIVDYISEGDRIDFSCVAVGDDPVYQWERTDGSLALPSSAIFIGSQLTIPRVTAADQGTYKCTASSAYGAPMSDEVVLKLDGLIPTGPAAPSISVSSELKYGAVINISCSSSSEDETLRLIRRGVTLTQSGLTGDNIITFRVGPLSANDFGIYECEASLQGRTATSATDISVPGPAPPVLAIIRPAQPIVPKGSSIVFDCGALGAFTYKWGKEGESLPSNSRVSNNLLYIDMVTESNMGDYHCIASNVNGAVNATATLSIQDEAKNDSSTTTSEEDTSPSVTSTETTSTVSSTVFSTSTVTSTTPTTEVTEGSTTTATPQSRTGPPVISSCRSIRTAGDACLIVLEAELKEATLDCRVNSDDIVKYEWTTPGNDSILSSEAVLRVVVGQNAGPQIFTCMASNGYGSTNETFQLNQNDFLPSFVNDGSYLELDEIRDAYMSTTLEISFTPSADTGLLLYSGAQMPSLGAPQDYIALGLANGLVLFKFDLGSKTEEVASSDKVKMDQPNVVTITRDRKNVTMTLNGDVMQYVSTGAFTGLNLNQPLFLAGVPDGLVDDYAGFTNSFAGTVNNLVVQGEQRYFDADDALSQGVLLANACSSAICNNGGMCVNAYNDMGYECVCPKNYAGEMCSSLGESCYPGYCSNGGICENLDLGPTCTCKLGYEGMKCEIVKEIGTPLFSGNGFIQYSPLEGVLRMTKMEIIITPTTGADGLIAYAGENQFGSGDFIALLLRNSSVVFTYDLGGGPVVIEGIPKVEPGKTYRLDAERTDAEGSLVINGGIAQKASGGRSSIGLNVKTPFFVGGVSRGFVLPVTLEGLAGLEGCVSKISVMSNDLDLINDAEQYQNIESCAGNSNVQGDDPCSILPCGQNGKCISKGSSDFDCLCNDDYIGKFCDVKKTACTVSQPCQNNGICEPIGSNSFKCRCIVGWTGETCETKSNSPQYAYARGSPGSVVNVNDFKINSNLANKYPNSSKTPLIVSNSNSPSRFHDATRPKDYFKYIYQRLKGTKDNTITSGKKACFGGDGYLELPREILPSSSQEMSVQLTVNTTSYYGVLYWQGQSAIVNGAGQDFFGVGLANGYAKFSFELGGGPAVLLSTIPVNDGKPHVIIATRKGREGFLKVDDEPEVMGSSGGTMRHLNGNGNVYIGGVPHYKRMVSTSFNSGFTGCISHVKTSALHGAIDLFKKKLSGVDVGNQ